MTPLSGMSDLGTILTPSASPIEAEAGRGMRVVVLHGNVADAHVLRTTGSLVIGRSPTADLRIDDGSVSRRHAKLIVGSMLQIQDLDSANSTWVRGQRLRGDHVEDLRQGNMVEIGSTMMLISGKHPAPGQSATTESGATAMEQLHRMIECVAASDISVLLQAETGAGKEVFARALHERSPRAGKPFVGLNCATLSETLCR
jgi:two-component system, NtrC family, response regulator AtoC